MITITALQICSNVFTLVITAKIITISIVTMSIIIIMTEYDVAVRYIPHRTVFGDCNLFILDCQSRTAEFHVNIPCFLGGTASSQQARPVPDRSVSAPPLFSRPAFFACG